MARIHESMADDDFDKARTKELLSRFRNFLDPSRENLMSLDEIKSILKPKGETYRGMQAVEVKDIVGSEGRYHDFNRYFLPRHEYLRSRWVRVNLAHYTDIILPPIRLYEIGGVYFVRDGNHRVSVAHLQGTSSIDAEVVSLSTEISIEPGMSRHELKLKVIGYEQTLFSERTDFEAVTGAESLEFTEPGRFDVILNHILVHKYFINQNNPSEIPLSFAVKSWYEKVYLPIISIIREERVTSKFRGRTEADIYVWIVRHWNDLKSKYGLNFPLEEAVLDFSRKYGKTTGKSFFSFLSSVFRKKKNK